MNSFPIGQPSHSLGRCVSLKQIKISINEGKINTTNIYRIDNWMQ